MVTVIWWLLSLGTVLLVLNVWLSPPNMGKVSVVFPRLAEWIGLDCSGLCTSEDFSHTKSVFSIFAFLGLSSPVACLLVLIEVKPQLKLKR